MNCKEIRDNISDYIEKRCLNEVRRAIDNHCIVCPACRKIFEDVSWTIEQCGEFPSIEPSPDLMQRILDTTIHTRTQPNFANTIFRFSLFKRFSPAYVFATAVMILLFAGVIMNFPGLLRNVNRYTHQAYSICLKYYYGTEKIKERISTIRENFPGDLDTGAAKSIGWLKSKIKKEEEKKPPEKKEKARLFEDIFYRPA